MNLNVKIIRIPAVYPWKIKAKLIKDLLDALHPVNISLQYVPYAFSAKGLPFSLLTSLLPLRHRHRWEITAHELWVDPTTKISNRILSMLQRMILLGLCRRLQPVAVHVTNHLYQCQLSKYNIKSSILPLFSSIPLCPLSVQSYRTQSQWIFVLFGSINRDWHPEKLLEQIDLARKAHGIQSCRFISVGNIGDYGAKLWNSLQYLPFPNFEFLSLGLLSASDVSEQLQLADFGICVSPSLLIGKSSSVAAMLAHGLPIIISRLSADSEIWHKILKQNGKYILLDSSFVYNLGAVRKYQPVDQLANTTHRFASSLSLTS